MGSIERQQLKQLFLEHRDVFVGAISMSNTRYKLQMYKTSVKIWAPSRKSEFFKLFYCGSAFS